MAGRRGRGGEETFKTAYRTQSPPTPRLFSMGFVSAHQGRAFQTVKGNQQGSITTKLYIKQIFTFSTISALRQLLMLVAALTLCSFLPDSAPYPLPISITSSHWLKTQSVIQTHHIPPFQALPPPRLLHSTETVLSIHVHWLAGTKQNIFNIQYIESSFFSFTFTFHISTIANIVITNQLHNWTYIYFSK